nr:solute carrier organic anion transporter family member 4A1-like [Lytechinus pictus]
MSGDVFHHGHTSQVALSEQDELDIERGKSSDPLPSSTSKTASSPIQLSEINAAPRDGYDSVNGVVVDDVSPDLDCGWFSCRPGWLQHLRKPPFLLVSLCFATILQGMIVNGFTPSSITSIERRFLLSSQSTGILVSVYDFTNIIFVLFVVYVGGRGHKIRWVGVGCVLIGVSGILYALPHFTTPPYSYVDAISSGNNGSSSSGVCNRDGSGEDDACSSSGGSESNLSNYIYLFCAAQVVAGIGSLPLYSLGLTAMDESISSKAYGPYFGTFYACIVLGPGLGFILSGSFLDIFTEITIPEGVMLSPSDPGWIGAWWLGFIIVGCIIILLIIPFSLFPKEFPTTARIRAEKSVEAHANSGLDITTRAGFGERPSDLLRALRYLLTNPTFVFTCLGGVADALLINGFNAFLPKVFENQFSLSAGFATIVTGVLSIFGGFFGSLSAGFVLRRFNLKIRGLLKLIAAANFISGLLTFIFLWHCPQQNLAGVTEPYTNTIGNPGTNLTSECNSDCSCAVEQFLPVCGGNGINYFTPCHAGCDVNSGNGTYTECTCLEGPLETVESGLCQTSCSYQPYVWSVLAAAFVFVVFFAQIPELNVILRCVPDSQRSMAIGLTSLLKRGLGSVPGPIIVGAVIDQACILWQDVCGTRGSCWIYDNASLAWRLTVIALALKAAACCMYLIAMVCYRPALVQDNEVSGTENKGANFEKDINC